MPISRLVAMLAVAVALVTGSGAGQCQTASAIPQEQPPPTVGQKPAAQGESRTDLYGDPLPDGAVARLGAARFRHALLSDFVLLPDGRTVLTAGRDRFLRFWDLGTGRPTRVVQLQGKTGPGFRVTLSPDGKILLARVGNRIVCWDVDSGKETRAIPAPEQHWHYLRFSPDGKTVAVGRSDWRVSLVDTATGLEREFPLPAHPGPMKKFNVDSTCHGSFSPDGKWFVAGAQSQEPLGVFEVATGREVRRLDAFAHTSKVSPDSKRLAVVSRNDDKGEEQVVIRLFDLANGKELSQIPVGKHERYSYPEFSLAFSPNGNILACGCSDRSFLLDLTTGRVLHRFPGRPVAPAFSRDGKTLIAGVGQRLRMWDVASGKEFSDRPGDFGSNQPVLAVSPDGRRVASGDYLDEVVSIWDATDGRLLHRLPLKGLGRFVRSLGFSGDSRTVVAAQERGFLQWWDVATGNEQRSAQLHELDGNKGQGLYFYHLLVSADGKRVSTLDFSPEGDVNRLALWDAGSGKPLARHLCFANSPHIAWLCEGKSVVVPMDDGLSMLNVATGAMRLRFAGVVRADRALVVSPDGRLLAGRKDGPDGKQDAGTIVVWETATGKEVASVVTGGVGQIALTPDNRSVVTTEYGLVCVRDLATGKVRHRWAFPDGEIGSRGITWVLAMPLSPDGRRAFTVVADGTALVWDLTPGLRRGEPPVKEPSGQVLAAWWADLAGEDPAKAQREVWALADAPKQAVPFLGGRLKPIAPPDEKRVRRWLADLDSDDFSTRQAAQGELARLAELVEPIVQETLKGNLSLETRRRLEQLLAKTHGLSPPDELRVLRAVQALELIGTSEARTLLQALTKGAAGARLTREAQESLERLNKRAVVYTGR